MRKFTKNLCIALAIATLAACALATIGVELVEYATGVSL